MKESHSFCMIREDNREIKAAYSAFPRKKGDVLERDGYKWKVVSLHEHFNYAKGFIGCYGKTLFTFFNFNN